MSNIYMLVLFCALVAHVESSSIVTEDDRNVTKCQREFLQSMNIKNWDRCLDTSGGLYGGNSNTNDAASPNKVSSLSFTIF